MNKPRLTTRVIRGLQPVAYFAGGIGCLDLLEEASQYASREELRDAYAAMRWIDQTRAWSEARGERKP